MEARNVAVIGSGITGLSTAWLLHRNGANVSIFEKEATCGGHTLTDTSSPHPIDLGFQVYNLTTYPNFVGFLECLGVDTEPSEMSFALSMDDGALEWASHDISTVFAQRKNWWNPHHWRMVWEIVRFGRNAPKVLDPATHHVYRTMTLGEYLVRERYSRYFVNNYVVPMCAAVWSVPNQQVLAFPVQMLIRFWVNHHLLDITQRPLWRVVKGRSREYVKRVCQELPDVRTSCAVVKVVRKASGSSADSPAVTITTEHGDEIGFDAVVFATHSDVTLAILGQDASPEEQQVLAAIPYNENDIYLHTDASLMPKDRKVWASWNFLGSSDSTSAADTTAVCVSYWANRLQHLPPGAPDFFVTLNPPHAPAAEHVFRRLKLAHPVFSFQSWEAQEKIADLQGSKGSTYFAGAWCGYGFHEDGIRAAVSAVKAMGGSIPWTCRTTSPKISLSQQWFMKLFDAFAKAAFKVGHLRIVLPNGHELSYGDPNYQHHTPEGEAWRGRPAPRAVLRVFNMDFFQKVVLRHDTGMGEAYMNQDYEVDDIGGFMSVVVANAYHTEEARGSLGLLNWIGNKLLLMAHLARPNTIEGSRRNIEEHYDAGNAMYKLFLDESMMYSCAIHVPGESLHQAQMRKLDAVIAAAGLEAGDHVLEVGCGWGGFAIRAVQRTGCRVTGLTVSKAQLQEANMRVKALGLSDRITFLFCDYRDHTGVLYDKVVSIEMIEAVGHENLPTYFNSISRLLKPGGKAVLQAICTPDERYEAYRNCSDFIREHIFPGGHLVCVGACLEAARGAGLSLQQTNDIGPNYAVTLREWRKSWEANKDEILKLGYSERFWRKYRFYFVFCEAGFDARYIHTFHMTWRKDSEASETVSAPLLTSGLPTSGHHLASAALCAMQRELPSDPINQVLLAVYFFLVGMLVGGHPYMWILPLVSCCCALLSSAIHVASLALLPSYRSLNLEKQAWWCADVLHLAYSAAVSIASLCYIANEPRAVQLHAQPADTHVPSVIIACATGFFAFYLWLCVRYRLFNNNTRAIVQYTLLLMLFGVATFKAINLPFLATTLVAEVSSVFLLVEKLRSLAGACGTSTVDNLLKKCEKVTFIGCRIIPHMIVTGIVGFTPSAFPNGWYHMGALLGLSYMNASSWYRTATRGHRQSQGAHP